jgi:hypothetical protein
MQKKRRRKSHAWAPLKGQFDIPLERLEVILLGRSCLGEGPPVLH